MTSWLHRPRAVFALSTLSLAVFAATFPARSESAERQDDFRWDQEVPAGSTLRVFTVAGTVTVRQSDGRTARVRGETRNEGDDRIRYVTEPGDGSVRICALREGATCNENGISSGGRGWGRDRRARANFTIEVPRGVVVRVSSGNGDVRVDGATADVHAASGNGDVSVGSGAATVRATTGNGAVRVDAARGPVNATSGNGRVTVSTAVGPVEASTGNGEINVSMAALRGRDDLEFSSGNGSITLTLPRDFSAELDASTGNGGVDSEFPMRVQGRMNRQRVRATIGDGGRRLHVSTGNGTIRLRRAGES